MAASLIEASVREMRNAHPTTGQDGHIGSPYTRGYLDAADACLQAVDETSCARPEDLPARLAERCQEIADQRPCYAKIGPDGSWLPGSPYDQGRIDGALRIRDAFVKMCEK